MSEHSPTPSWGQRLYPGSAARRRSVVAADVIALLMLALFAWLGWRLYLRVDGVTSLALGVQHAGQSVSDGFTTAADAVSGVPLVGDSLAGALTGAGDATGGNVMELGQQGEHAIHLTALLAGWLVFLLPSTVLVLSYLPGRVRQVRTAGLATAMLHDGGDPERCRLLAMRAAFGLPLQQLARFTDDPIGDLAAGRHDRLIAALRDDAGLDPALVSR